MASPTSLIKNKQFKINLDSASSSKKMHHSRGFHNQTSAMSQDYSDQM